MDKCKHKTATGRCTVMCDFSDKHRCKGEKYCHERSPMTNADHLREAISTEEGLAKLLMAAHDAQIITIKFCQNREECWELIGDPGFPDEKCMECMMQWLRKPWEGDRHGENH